MKDDSNYNVCLDTACGIGRKEVGLSVRVPGPANAIKRAGKKDLLTKQVMRKEAVSASKKHKAAALNGGGDGGGELGDLDSQINVDKFDDINFYMKKIYAAHSPNSFYNCLNPVYIDPANPCQYILLTVSAIQDWAKALEWVFNPSKLFALPGGQLLKRSKLEWTVGTDNIFNFPAQLLAAVQDGGNQPSNQSHCPPLRSPPNESNIEVYT
ncbi:hypothetical protein H4Q26_010571 [Puccinia striiformis f. sp. tritici PST-130]|nr:hypothetical protein H4Q26_010571 [Puccinia striiformis f. sp. tritici PST-130]